MFWTKCGKLLTDGSGHPINCDFCPCGGYAVFAFLERSITPATPQGNTNYCAGQSARVLPMEIKNGHICYVDPYGMSGSIDFALHAPDSEKKVAYYKGCGSQWEDCVEWDEQTWQCIEEQTYYQDCKEIKVYQLTPCFDNYENFRQAFFEACDDSSSSEGETPEYPDVWQGGYLTSEAEQCLQNYWSQYGNALRIANNIDIYQFRMSYNASAWDMVCVDEEHVVQTDPETGEIIWEYDECLDYETLLLHMYNTTWGQDYSIPVPEHATQEQIDALIAQGLQDCNQLIEDAWENYAGWPYTIVNDSGLCFNHSLTGGGSCYGGYGCHSFLWDGAGYNLYKFNQPASVGSLAYIPTIGVPTGVQINWNGQIINVHWGNFVESDADADKTQPYYLIYDSCYGQFNPQCPSSTNTVNYQLQATIKYIWS